MLCEGGGLCIHTSFPNPYGQILQNLLYIMRSFGHYSTMQGDLFGRCPTQSDLETGEASKDPAHWVGWCLHFDISNIFGQIRCDNTCPLQSYTPNDVIISKFEHLAKKFPQTAKMVEVGQKKILTWKLPLGWKILIGPAYRWPPDQWQCPPGERAVEAYGEQSTKKNKETSPSAFLPGAVFRQHARQRAGGPGDAGPPCPLSSTSQANLNRLLSSPKGERAVNGLLTTDRVPQFRFSFVCTSKKARSWPPLTCLHSFPPSDFQASCDESGQAIGQHWHHAHPNN